MRRVLFCCALLFCLLAISCKGPEGPSGPPGPDFASLTDASIQPAVIYTYPSSGSHGPYTGYNNRVVVRFNKIMDRTAIQRGTVLSSALGDVRLDTTGIAAQNTDAFTLAPVDTRGPSHKFLWKIGQSYSVDIDTTVVDVNGNRLHQPFHMSFTPETVFRVVSISPIDATTDVATSSIVTFTFNSPVDSGIVQYIHVTPALTGQWRYVAALPAPDSTILRLTYTGGIPDTNYHVTIDPAAHDRYGNLIQGAYSSSFTMISFRVSGQTPTSGATGVGLTSAVTLTFPAPIDTASARAAFSITPSIPGILSFPGTGTTIRFTAIPRFMTNTSYSVTLSNGISSRTGEHPSGPFVLSFLTQPYAISSTVPADGGINVSTSTVFQVRMTDLIDTASVRAAFSISPPVPGTLSLFDSSNTIQFTPAGPLASGAVYTCTLLGSVRSSRGDSLGTPVSYAFSTLPFAVASVSPSDGAGGVGILAHYTVTFTAPIDTVGLGTAFTITPPVPGFLSTYYGSLSATFNPTSEMTPNTLYHVTVSPAVRAVSGETLGQETDFSFTTADFLVSSTTPAEGSIGAPKAGAISFNFTANIDTGTVRSAFSISGNPPGRFSMGTSSFSWTPNPPLSANTFYTVTLSPTVKTKGGFLLSAPSVFSFQTGP